MSGFGAKQPDDRRMSFRQRAEEQAQRLTGAAANQYASLTRLLAAFKADKPEEIAAEITLLNNRLARAKVELERARPTAAGETDTFFLVWQTLIGENDG